MLVDRPAQLDDLDPLEGEHVGDVDVAALGDHQLEQQLTAQVAQVGDRRRQPPAQLGTARPGGGQNRPVAAGDARLLPHGMHEAADRELIERAVRERARQRPHPSDLALRFEMGGDREPVRRRWIQDPEARPFAEQELLLRRTAHAHHGSILLRLSR